jgi:two-component system sensor histidine kinase DesK
VSIDRVTGPPPPSVPWSPFRNAQGLVPAAGRRWRLYASAWLVYMLAPLGGALDIGGVRGGIGVAMVAVFVVLYATGVPRGFNSHRFGRAIAGALFALSLGMLPFTGEKGLASFVFVVVACLVTLPRRAGYAALGLLVLLAGVLPYVVPGWADDGVVQAIQILLAAAVILAMFGLLRANRELRQAREDLTRLAALEERERIARDIHDVLGHTLTVITLKATLARRLMDSDVQRAAEEMADVERLAREGLADVRATVTATRNVSLTGELASARSALDAAGIEAELPSAVDDVPGDRRELFGWAVREGVTNVLRHSRARRCVVTLTSTSVEIQDDGVWLPIASKGDGNGLRGLTDRASALGGLVEAGRVNGGYRLRVEIPTVNS